MNVQIITKMYGQRISLSSAKKNMRGYFQRGKWRKKPRINEDDMSVLGQITRSTGVDVAYEPSTNHLHFNIPKDGNSLEFSGEETGGQIIRILLQVAILRTGGRTFGSNEILNVPSPKKASTLYIQIVLYLLDVHDSFTIKGGDSENSKAPNVEFWRRIFSNILQMTGRTYKIEQNDDSLTVTRQGNSPEPVTVSSFDTTVDSIDSSNHMTDQLLMAYFFTANSVNEGEESNLTVKYFKNKRDFHVPALIRGGYETELNGENRQIPDGVLRSFGFRVEILDEDDTTQTIRIRPPIVGKDLRGF